MTGEVISKLPGTFMDIMSRVRENEPLIHCMTHAITMNDSANAILAGWVGVPPWPPIPRKWRKSWRRRIPWW